MQRQIHFVEQYEKNKYLVICISLEAPIVERRGETKAFLNDKMGMD